MWLTDKLGKSHSKVKDEKLHQHLGYTGDFESPIKSQPSLHGHSSAESPWLAAAAYSLLMSAVCLLFFVFMVRVSAHQGRAALPQPQSST